jgi:hypothetical protein
MTPMERPAAASAATVWLALLVSPLLVLCHLSVAYSLVSPSCARQDSTGLHALTLLSLLLSLAMTLLAWRTWRRLTPSDERHTRVSHSDAGHAESRQPFLALVATLVGALSTLVIVAMGLPLWLLPPCS